MKDLRNCKKNNIESDEMGWTHDQKEGRKIVERLPKRAEATKQDSLRT